MTAAVEFRSIAAIKRANRALGHHWFDADAMRFFNTVIESGVIDGSRFITSERMEYSDPKRYSVREARGDGSIETVGEFRAYGTLVDAYRAALAA